MAKSTKKVTANLKLKIPAGKANAGPPVGSTLGQYGVNMMDFVQPFNEQTKDMRGIVTAHIQVYDDRSMDFRVISQPTDDLILQKLGVDKGSGRPNTEKLEKKLTDKQVTEIAKEKMKDMNTDRLDSVKKMVAGTARSMGIEVQE